MFMPEKMLPDSVVAHVKHNGRSVMIWGCFSRYGTVDLVQIQIIMKKDQYKIIFEINAIPSDLRIIGNRFILQQDNNCKHSSKFCKNYLEQKKREMNIKKHGVASSDPNLNLIELVLEQSRYKRS